LIMANLSVDRSSGGDLDEQEPGRP
jgi:hypothetical protein